MVLDYCGVVVFDTRDVIAVNMTIFTEKTDNGLNGSIGRWAKIVKERKDKL